MRGGLGSASLRLGDGLVVGALAAVNALGDIVDPGTGQIVAGALRPDGRGFADSVELVKAGRWGAALDSPANTTLGVVAG